MDHGFMNHALSLEQQASANRDEILARTHRYIEPRLGIEVEKENKNKKWTLICQLRSDWHQSV